MWLLKKQEMVGLVRRIANVHLEIVVGFGHSRNAESAARTTTAQLKIFAKAGSALSTCQMEESALRMVTVSPVIAVEFGQQKLVASAAKTRTAQAGKLVRTGRVSLPPLGMVEGVRVIMTAPQKHVAEFGNRRSVVSAARIQIAQV